MSQATKLKFSTNCRLLPNGKIVGVITLCGTDQQWQTRPCKSAEEIVKITRLLRDELARISEEKEQEA